jgi:hypothetical protein
MKRIIDYIKNNWVWILLYSLLIIIFFRSFNFSLTSWFIDQWFAFLDITTAINDRLFLWWDKRSFWENQFLFLLDIFEYFIYLILIKIWFIPIYVSWIVKLSIILLIPYLFFINLKWISEWVLGKIISNNYYWVLSFIPIFTLWFFNEEWHILFSQRLNWIMWLLLFYFINKYIFTKKWLLSLFAISFLSIFSFNLFPFFLVFHIFIFLYLVLLVISHKVTLKKVCIWYLLYALITCFSWFNILYLYWTVDLQSSDSIQYANDLKYYVTSNNHIDNLFRWVFHLIWWWTLWWDLLSQTFPYQKHFQNIFFYIVSYISILLFFFLLIKIKIKNIKNKSIFLFFIIVLITSLFISKWNNAPFWDIYLNILEKIQLLNIYRSPANKFMPLFYTVFTFSFFILFTYLSKNIAKKIIYLLFSSYIILSLPLLYTWIFSKSSSFEIPNYYSELNHFFNQNNYNGRVLFLPERNYWKSYSFWAYVNSLNYFNIKNTTFDIWQTLMSSNNVLWNKLLLNSTNFFYKKGNSYNPNDIYQRGKVILDKAGINIKTANNQLINSKVDFVILDNGLSWTFNSIKISNIEKSYYKYLVDNLSWFKRIKTIWNFDVYIKKWILYWNNIFNSNSIKKVNKISPVKYNISIWIKDISLLEQISSFDSDWKIYLSPINKKEDKISFNILDIKYIFKKDIFGWSHNKLNWWANQWSINKKYIIDNYSSDYYTINKDWTININLVVYYLPQSYFYVSMLISIFTFIFSIWFIYFRKYLYKNEK